MVSFEWFLEILATLILESRFGDETISNLSELAHFIPSVIVRSDKLPMHLTDHLLQRYSKIIEPVYQFKLDGEIALWRQKWASKLTDRPDVLCLRQLRKVWQLATNKHSL